jgi:hypothetical protein
MSKGRSAITNAPRIISAEPSRQPNDCLPSPYGWGDMSATYYDIPHYDGVWRVPLKYVWDGSLQFEFPFQTLKEANEFYELMSGHCLS